MIDILTTRFQPSLDDKHLREAITVRPEPVLGLENLNRYVAAERLSETLKKVFIPTAFTLDLIQEMLGRAQSFSVDNFSTEQQYLSCLYNPPAREVFPICFTGLAGVGKSATITALRKVLPSPQALKIDHYVKEAVVVSHWYASARESSLVRQLLADLLNQTISSRDSVAELIARCRRRAYAEGVSIVLLDEMQFVNLGQGAARVTDILLSMAKIGAPLIYVANYSLVHKLKERNSEDTQRLLSEPRIMLPDTLDCKSWHEYMRECLAACNDRLKIEAKILAEDLYRFTFGIKRFVVQLLKLAYLEARSASRFSIERRDLQAAFVSSGYSVHKIAVEELVREAIQKSSTGIRKDLKCPFTIPLRSSVIEFSRKDREQRVATKVLVSALTKTELSGLQEVAPNLFATNLPSNVKKTSVRKTSDEEMAKNHARLLAKTLDSKNKPNT